MYQAVLREHYANLDSGCYYGQTKNGGYGELTGLLFPEMRLVTEKYSE